MKILLVSGFLGAGKTTFIKELIKRSEKQFVVLENEYGQNSLDSNELKNSSTNDLQLIDFAEGCVCCSKKDDFSSTILTISACLDPEYLIVEPTGVGKLSNIMLAINKVSYEKIKILPPIVVVSCDHFDENMNLFNDICIDQLKNASKVILSKIENTNIDVINDVKNKINAINPNCEILTEHYSLKDDKWYESLLYEDGQPKEVIQDSDAGVLMDQLSLKNIQLQNIGQLVVLLEEIIHYDLGIIPRGKGIVKIENEYVRFDIADGLYEIIDEPNSTTSECVFIGRYIDVATIKKRLNVITTTKLTKNIKLNDLKFNKPIGR